MSFVAADTPSVNYLVWCQAVSVPRSISGQVVIPSAVCHELNHERTQSSVRTWSNALPDCVTLTTPTRPDPRPNLGPAERATIALAHELTRLRFGDDGPSHAALVRDASHPERAQYTPTRNARAAAWGGRASAPHPARGYPATINPGRGTGSSPTETNPTRGDPKRGPASTPFVCSLGRPAPAGKPRRPVKRSSRLGQYLSNPPA